MPLARLGLNFRGVELLTPTVHDLINAVIPFARIKPGDVVIVLILAVPDGTAALVFIGGDGLNLDA